MSNFNLYVHGVPVGHEIWGPAEDQEHIKNFYDNDSQEDVASVFCIENANNKTFYTYIRKRNVQNSEGRPGSFIGITISFAGKCCKNTYTLFQLFEAIYERGIVGKIIERNNGFERYKIRSFANDASSILNSIHKTFETQLSNLVFQSTENLPKSNGCVRYNLKDVDSPAFFETSKTKKILISAEFPSKDEETKQLLQNIVPLKEKCTELTNALSESQDNYSSAIKSNNTLQQQIDSLQKANKDLDNQLKTVEKNIKNKYDHEIIELEKKLRNKEEELKKRKESSEQEIKDSINSINEPIQKLARLMASRFPGHTINYPKGEQKESHTRSSVFNIQTWINTILTIILCGIVGFNTYSLFKVKGIIEQEAALSPKREQDIEDKNHSEAPQATNLQPAQDSVDTIQEALEIWIDISGNDFNKIAKYNTEYTLKAKCNHKDKHTENECLKDKTPIFKIDGIEAPDNKLKITDTTKQQVKIECFIGNKIVKERTINVKK